ncbi:hypothetical protein [Rhodophyticola porphyridii]|uniref:hypothetical protein n=1 Tax=Rhodophyticola porphyridii TaxID=1852017 RepID=UPI0011C384F0|nr:hypothetical protein [Rhodophyticola porphyridii]
MRTKMGVIAALAAITARVGVPDGAYAQDAGDIDQRCNFYAEIEDRSLLQQELERLLELRPEDPCISFLVDRLGGGPIAEIPEEPY